MTPINGQDRLNAEIENMLAMPNLTIVAGSDLYTVKLTVNKLCENFNLNRYDIEGKSEDIQNLIDNAMKTVQPTAYVIYDFKRIRPQTYSKLLKLTEEPPIGCYIIIQVDAISTLPETFINRGRVLKIEPYTTNDMIELIKIKMPDYEHAKHSYLVNFITSPAELEDLLKLGKSINHLTDITEGAYNEWGQGKIPGGLLLLSSYFKFKKDDEGIPLYLFLKLLLNYTEFQLLINFSTSERELEEYRDYIRSIQLALNDCYNGASNLRHVFDAFAVGNYGAGEVLE